MKESKSLNSMDQKVRCVACKQSFSVSSDERANAQCPNCGVMKNFSRLDSSIDRGDFSQDVRSDLFVLEERLDSGVSGARGPIFDSALSGIDDDIELSLKPAVERVQSASESTYGEPPRRWSEPAESNLPTSVEKYEPVRAAAYGEYPRRRDYPALSSLRRLYAVFGYVGVAIVFAYLLIEAGLVVYRSDGDLLVNLAVYSRWAVPTVFGTVAVTAAMLAASEGITLAMDIQENTLRAANELNRRRP